MPTSTPMPTKNPGDVLTSTLWNNYLRDNIDKLLTRGHRVLTVAQFAALTGPEGTKGTVAPDEAYVEVDSTNGVVWHFHYESTDASASKWRFIGGPPLYAIVGTSESTASGADTDLATVGPSIVIPRLGDYDIDWGAQTTGTGAPNALITVYGGVTSLASISDFVDTGTGATQTANREHRVTGRATSETMKLKYASSNASSISFSTRWLRVKPVRIG